MHHAYLLIGDKIGVKELLQRKLAELGFVTQGNPDFYSLELETLGIDEARDISERANRKAFGDMKVFFISAGTYTGEAQNALLKTLEDPVPNTHFFISARTSGELIPTLVSRMQTLAAERGETADGDVEKFLAIAPAKRLLFAKKFADDERSLAGFLDRLLAVEAGKGAQHETLDAIYNLRRYAADRAAASRLILEHLALVL